MSYTVAPGDYLKVEGNAVKVKAQKTDPGNATETVTITFSKGGKTATKEVTVTIKTSRNTGGGGGGSHGGSSSSSGSEKSTDTNNSSGVGYGEDAPAFTDIADHWAKEDIEFVVSRGLFRGTSDTTFSPKTAMTRGMFVTVLGRLANANVSSFQESSFTDVKNDLYYMSFIEWANRNGIVKGIGDKKFAPDQAITREQMAVIMSNYVKTMNLKLNQVHEENNFADSAHISAYAEDAVKQMQMAGILSGKKGNLFDPQGMATRAEVSAVVHRFVELSGSSNTM